MIVVIVVSIIAVYAVFGLPSKAAINADTFPGIFLHDLRLTEALSMSQNQRYRLVVGASSYQIQNQSGVAIVHPQTGTTSVTYPANLTISPNSGNSATVIFDSLGKPYDGSGAALSSSLTFTVSSGGINKTVSVTPQTGFLQ